MDREGMSPTAGCCDRNYWAWKFVDFPGARFQESLCALAFVWSESAPDSPFRGSPTLLEWIHLGLEFWCGLQHRDGSFDEAYPFERSLAATAFTTFYVSEAVEMLGDAIRDHTRERVVETVHDAGRWLLANDESHGVLSNHLAAAAAALAHAHRLTGVRALGDRSRYFLGLILSRQSDEGWYEEYGGADPGYQTHGSFYLARCLELAPDENLRRSLYRSVDFIAHFVHPDRSLGGEYASRNTKTYYPAAFEMLAAEHEGAAWIAGHMRPGVAVGAAASLRGIDAYNYFPFLNNYVFALRACAERDGDGGMARDPTPGSGCTRFPDAGLLRVRRPSYELFMGTTKGGVLKVFDRSTGELLLSDCGYVGRLSDGRLCSSQYLDPRRPVETRDDEVIVEGSFMELGRPAMTPARFIGFRLFSLTVGRVPPVGRWLKRLLVRVLIHRKRPIPLRFERRVRFAEGIVEVEDRIGGPGLARLERLEWAPLLTTIHMGSARYYVANELASGAERSIDLRELATGAPLRRSARPVRADA